MDELVKAVAEKTGLPEEQARSAAQAAIEFLKTKLPAPIAGQLDGFLASPQLGDNADDIVKGLGGMLGR